LDQYRAKRDGSAGQGVPGELLGGRERDDPAVLLDHGGREAHHVSRPEA
jgi:hypothetical protein